MKFFNFNRKNLCIGINFFFLFNIIISHLNKIGQMFHLVLNVSSRFQLNAISILCFNMPFLFHVSILAIFVSRTDTKVGKSNCEHKRKVKHIISSIHHFVPYFHHKHCYNRNHLFVYHMIFALKMIPNNGKKIINFRNF